MHGYNVGAGQEDIGTVVTHILRSDSINYSDQQLESQTSDMEGECLVFQTESKFHSKYCLFLHKHFWFYILFDRVD